ncbi:ribonuclease P protein component [bacterium]|nr:ribonuclease P protein component [bacterium]
MAKQTFSSSRHIRKKKHFQAIFSDRQAIQNYEVKVVYAKKYFEESKAAFVASKRIGNAVVRNKSKRRLKELVRANQGLLPSDYDVVFVAKRELRTLSYQQLEQGFIHLLTRLRNRR